MRREARLHELRVAGGFAKEHEIVRRDPAEVEENYGVEAACTLDPEATEGPYCEQRSLNVYIHHADFFQGLPASSFDQMSLLARRAL